MKRGRAAKSFGVCACQSPLTSRDGLKASPPVTPGHNGTARPHTHTKHKKAAAAKMALAMRSSFTAGAYRTETMHTSFPAPPPAPLPLSASSKAGDLIIGERSDSYGCAYCRWGWRQEHGTAWIAGGGMRGSQDRSILLLFVSSSSSSSSARDPQPASISCPRQLLGTPISFHRQRSDLEGPVRGH